MVLEISFFMVWMGQLYAMRRTEDCFGCVCVAAIVIKGTLHFCGLLLGDNSSTSGGTGYEGVWFAAYFTALLGIYVVLCGWRGTVMRSIRDLDAKGDVLANKRALVKCPERVIALVHSADIVGLLVFQLCMPNGARDLV